MTSRTLSYSERNRLAMLIARELGLEYGDAMEGEEDEERHRFIADNVVNVVDGFLEDIDLSTQAPGGAFE